MSAQRLFKLPVSPNQIYIGAASLARMPMCPPCLYAFNLSHSITSLGCHSIIIAESCEPCVQLMTHGSQLSRDATQTHMNRTIRHTDKRSMMLADWCPLSLSICFCFGCTHHCNMATIDNCALGRDGKLVASLVCVW